MKIVRQDTNGIKPLLQTGELGYDNYPAGGDVGRVYVGTGTENIQLAKKADISDYAYSKEEVYAQINAIQNDINSNAVAMAIALS